MRSSGGGVSWKLADHPKLPKGKTVGLVVLDGWGEANPNQYNCIHVADTPTMDSLKKVLLFNFCLFVLSGSLVLIFSLLIWFVSG